MYLLVIYLLKEFQENWHVYTYHSYCVYELGVHAFLKSDLIVEVMYKGKDITFLGPHVCYTRTLYWKPIPKVIVND